MTQGGQDTFGTWEQAVLWLRSQHGSQELVVDAYYDDPLSLAAERFWQSEEWAATRQLIPCKPGMALDVGAGRGIASYALARDGWDVAALEPDPSAVVGAAAIRNLAHERDLPIKVEQHSSERLPFEDESFDLVYGRAVLHHIEDLASAMCEVRRVLKPDGRAVFVREHVISKEEDRQLFLDKHPLHKQYGGENAHQKRFYEKSLSDAGLIVTQVLGPLTSAVNYAPQTFDSLIAEICVRVGPKSVRSVLGAILHARGVGAIGMRLLECLDNRPGRHYSFVAIRP